jgi:hypothetical protein
MVINKIITEKTLNYIETLYTYANLQDFANSSLHPTQGYREVLRAYFDANLEQSKFLGTSHGRDWYQLPNYRIGIMDYDKAEIANQFNVEIQYTQSHMFSLDAGLKGLELPFGCTFAEYSIKRIDITQIVKTPNDYLTNHAYLSPYRTVARFSTAKETETVYLGHRKSGNVFRMYNKSIELNKNTKDHPIDYKKIELFSKYFGDIEDLYTFELELHRKYLKPTFDIDTLADLDKVYKAHKEIVGKIRIYEDNDHNRKLIETNNRSRIESLCFVEYKEFQRVQKKTYKPSVDYMIDKTIRNFESYEKSLSQPLTFANKLFVADRIITGLFGDKDVTLEIEESDYILENNILKDKISLLRDNQDDVLFREATEAFGGTGKTPYVKTA